MPNAFPAQTNQSRFTFVPRTTFLSNGDPSIYDVVDGGSSMNSAGFVCSAAGGRIGRIEFDPIMRRWGFLLDELRFANLDPNQAALGGADAKQISTFIGTLAIPAQVVLQ